MNEDKGFKEFGACGIDCSRCVSMKNGQVQRLSQELKAALTNFEKKAPIFAGFAPALAGYESFSAVLDFLSEGSCEGCRSGKCHTPGCSAKDCHREQGVDFCFQCKEYPCSRNQYDPSLEQKWRSNNDCMKAEGIEAFCQKSKSQPRY